MVSPLPIGGNNRRSFLVDRDTGVFMGIITCGRLLGLLAQTMGNLDQLMSHFEDALALLRLGRHVT